MYVESVLLEHLRLLGFFTPFCILHCSAFLYLFSIFLDLLVLHVLLFYTFSFPVLQEFSMLCILIFYSAIFQLLCSHLCFCLAILKFPILMHLSLCFLLLNGYSISANQKKGFIFFFLYLLGRSMYILVLVYI